MVRTGDPPIPRDGHCPLSVRQKRDAPSVGQVECRGGQSDPGRPDGQGNRGAVRTHRRRRKTASGRRKGVDGTDARVSRDAPVGMGRGMRLGQAEGDVRVPATNEHWSEH